MSDSRSILVLGGAGYVGCRLVPELLGAGHKVTVLDLMIYGTAPLQSVQGNRSFRMIQGDIRSREDVQGALQGCDTVIHLACISNDPSYDLDPSLGRSINYDCLPMIVEEAKRAEVSRFVYASSASVYGVKQEVRVTEDLPLEPLTDYSKYKALGEEVLLAAREPGFAVLVVRPATLCGCSPRQRLDLVVNILANYAYNAGKIVLYGGGQMRPNLHIEDMVDFYMKAMKWETAQIDGKIYNLNYENHSVAEIANTICEEIGKKVAIEEQPSDDIRSYRVCAERIANELGFRPSHSVREAIGDLFLAFKTGVLTDPLENPEYFNVRKMKKINLA